MACHRNSLGRLWAGYSQLLLSRWKNETLKSAETIGGQSWVIRGRLSDSEPTCKETGFRNYPAPFYDFYITISMNILARSLWFHKGAPNIHLTLKFMLKLILGPSQIPPSWNLWNTKIEKSNCDHFIIKIFSNPNL